MKGVEQGWQVVIVSGDKDFYQLIGPGVALLNPGRGGSAGVEEHWVDESNAAERLGVPPAQVADYLALVGDSSDNVPGVKGIGGKGAVELLQQFGDLESLLGRAEEVKNKRAREALIAYADAGSPFQGTGHHQARCAGDPRSRRASKSASPMFRLCSRSSASSSSTPWCGNTRSWRPLWNGPPGQPAEAPSGSGGLPPASSPILRSCQK